MQPQAVPVCPPRFAFCLLERGWAASHEALLQTVTWLENQGISDELSLQELSMEDLEGVDELVPEVSKQASH